MNVVLVLDAKICSAWIRHSMTNQASCRSRSTKEGETPSEFCPLLPGINGRENVDNDSTGLNGSRQFSYDLLVYV
jgi:hypothetical protein